MTSSATPDVIEALRGNPAALSRFEGLPPSHKAEYLKWINEAKRDDTRARRITGMIDKLIAAETEGRVGDVVHPRSFDV